MSTNDYIDFSEVKDWLATTLQSKNIIRFSQLTCRTEEELMDEGLTPATVRHIYLLLKDNGLRLRNSDDCINRLGLHKANLERLHKNYIDSLSDLEKYTYDELIYDCGFSRSTANYISSMMKYFGRPLKRS